MRQCMQAYDFQCDKPVFGDISSRGKLDFWTSIRLLNKTQIVSQLIRFVGIIHYE